MLQALQVGACRGVNLAITGPLGSGKSTFFEALDLIFNVCGKPERDNSFPLCGIVEAEVLLWQEFTWESKMCAFEDLLSMMAGEKFGVRRPGKPPLQFKNTSPMFYTAWQPLTFKGRDVNQVSAYNMAMNERFKIRQWTRSLPTQNRLPRFPQCAHCFAGFVLNFA